MPNRPFTDTIKILLLEIIKNPMQTDLTPFPFVAVTEWIVASRTDLGEVNLSTSRGRICSI